MPHSTSLDGSPLLHVDLTDPRVHAEQDLRPLFGKLRAGRPVAWHPPHSSGTRGFWVVTRHADMTAVCRDADRFVSTGGNVLSTLLVGGDSASGRMLAVSDGNRHNRLRRLLWQALTPGALASLQERIFAATKALIATALEKGDIDFARDVAAHIPLTAICDLLGVPEADRPFILRHTSAALSSESAQEATAAGTRLSQGELLLYFARLARIRRNEAQDDLITLLARGTVDGERLTDDEVVFNCYSLILGGDETTRLAMISGVRALMEHPDQWRALKDGSVSLESATEEILRWTSPAIHVGRTATQDSVLHGEQIRAGDVVTSWTLSANFDEAEFDRPLRFDLARTPNRHLAFAYGPHFCIGAHLARIEISALLAGLRQLVGGIDEAGPALPIYSTFLRGFSSLPVRFHL
ncbi:cytochrome P450 [Streptomyces albus]|uniref:cytochrome P450 n=1 Tax=Streptomyces sp. NRRL F-5917 TaxID=1463873 RepID=UPI0004C065D2|nr:cytochrome P450 [Streptomyces sp. NRRL F-5917]